MRILVRGYDRQKGQEEDYCSTSPQSTLPPRAFVCTLPINEVWNHGRRHAINAARLGRFHRQSAAGPIMKQGGLLHGPLRSKEAAQGGQQGY